MYDLSILIPTRNRPETAALVINGLLSLKLKHNIQIVVSDNSDTNELERIIDINNPNLDYKFINDKITFSENFDLGIKRCLGKYICAIGDDDYISSEIDLAIDYMDFKNIVSLSIQPAVSYFWGNVGKEGNILQISNTKCNIKKINVKNALHKLMNNGGQGYLDYAIPKIYHGIIRRDIVEKIVKKYGKLFDSLSPDIFSAYLLSQVIEYNYVTDYPFTIPGSSSKSASGKSINSKHVGNLEDAPHFRNWSNYIWDNNIPRFYSVETIWAESLIYAIKSIGAKDMIDYKCLYFLCYRGHPNFKKSIMNCANINSIPIKWKIKRYIYLVIKNAKRIVYRMRIIMGISDYYCEQGISDITSVNSIIYAKCILPKEMKNYE